MQPTKRSPLHATHHTALHHLANLRRKLAWSSLRRHTIRTAIRATTRISNIMFPAVESSLALHLHHRTTLWYKPRAVNDSRLSSIRHGDPDST
ncbi:hypothetical protein HOO65_010909 [Ceratocystis lukuohia]|uniref:Uncharacterized protein n=1 Tax=Ceratocystis lukuohia TaxID=2019550 RepID=A0ABR4MTC7_9PEZI